MKYIGTILVLAGVCLYGSEIEWIPWAPGDSRRDPGIKKRTMLPKADMSTQNKQVKYSTFKSRKEDDNARKIKHLCDFRAGCYFLDPKWTKN